MKALILKAITACLTIAVVFLPAVATAAGFAVVASPMFNLESIATGARATALGTTQPGTGPLAVVLNPGAALAGPRYQVSYEYCDYHSDVSLTSVGAAVRWRNLRFSVARFQIKVDDQVIRTAYNPEGTGEFLSLTDRAYTTGLSLDLFPGGLQERGYFVSVGAAWKHYNHHYAAGPADSTVTAYDFGHDNASLGLTMGFDQPTSLGRLEIRSFLAFQNILDTNFTIHERETFLPQYQQLGASVSCVIQPAGRPAPLARLTLGAALRADGLDGLSSLTNQLDQKGLEISLLETLAVRWGDLGRGLNYAADSTTFGLGLRAPRPLWLNLQPSLDWTHLDGGALDDYDLFSINMGARF